jgi:agmatine/peptidylarginine deiminase
MPATWTMPAEWAPHEGTWLAWPHEKSDWPGKFGPIPHFYGKLIAKLTRFEMVHLLCADERAAQAAVKAARQEHANLAALDLHLVPTDRSWLRDTAPIFVKSNRQARSHRLALQRLGQVRQLAERRRPARLHRRQTRPPPRPAPRPPAPRRA